MLPPGLRPMTALEHCNPDCPACAHRDKTPAQSIAQKTDWLNRRLAPWAKCLAAMRTVPAERQRGYRDRVSLTAMWRHGQWRFGVTHYDEFIDIPGCPVHSARVRATVRLLSTYLPPPADFKLAFLVQSAAQTVLVFKQSKRPDTTWFTDELAQQLSAIGLEGLWLHCFPSAGRNLFTKNGWHKLWGSERSQDAAGFWYGPGAFSQLLPALHAQSLDEAEAFLNPMPGDHVLDLYCGRGISLHRWRQRRATALGVERSGEALECAKLNAPGALLLRGSCAQRLPQLDQWWEDTLPTQRLSYLNPPRTGLEPAVSHWLAEQAKPKRIAYLSCSAGTLHRDLNLFCNAGYHVERITPYDFFPRTHHVETLALLRR